MAYSEIDVCICYSDDYSPDIVKHLEVDGNSTTRCDGSLGKPGRRLFLDIVPASSSPSTDVFGQVAEVLNTSVIEMESASRIASEA